MLNCPQTKENWNNLKISKTGSPGAKNKFRPQAPLRLPKGSMAPDFLVINLSFRFTQKNGGGKELSSQHLKTIYFDLIL